MDYVRMGALIGHVPILCGVAGSRRFGLETDTSDWDHYCFLSDGGNSEYEINSAYVLKEFPREDLFFSNARQLQTIEGSAEILAVKLYLQPGYAKPPLDQFLKENGVGMANVFPFSTYLSLMSMIERQAAFGSLREMSRVVREAGVLYRFYETGDMSKCYELPERFKRIYRLLREPECQLSIADVQALMHFLHTPTFRRYLKNTTANYELYGQFRSALDRALMEG